MQISTCKQPHTSTGSLNPPLIICIQESAFTIRLPAPHCVKLFRKGLHQLFYSQFLLVPICFCKGLHQLLSVPSCANLFPQRLTSNAPSCFLCQSVCARYLWQCGCVNFFLQKAYTIVLSVPACANLVSGSLHHEGFLSACANLFLQIAHLIFSLSIPVYPPKCDIDMCDPSSEAGPLPI